MSKLSQPLQFRQFLTNRKVSLIDPVPFVDLLFIGIFFASQASWFILTPGASVQLPVSHSQATVVGEPSAILTVGPNGLFFFDSRKISRPALRGQLADFVTESRNSSVAQPLLLLIKVDRQVSMELLFTLIDEAREAGFAEIHFAAEAPHSPEVSSPVITPP
jgi:biopolymer transport protein ExbD